MATASTRALAHFVRDCTASQAEGLPDDRLLDRFASQGDEAAFTALVHRHGALVLNVCRRMLRDWHAADDAFQTVFLVLATRAPSLRRPGPLGPWLHAVA